MQNPALILSDARGVYIPQNFVEEFDMTKFEGISEKDVEILKAGPDHEWYWETWDDVLGNASHTDEQGRKWLLHQDGDLWMYHAESMSNEDYANFFGETKPAPEDSLEFEVCENCLIAAANDDYSGMTDEEEAAVKAGLQNLQETYGSLTVDGADLGFSHVQCECCGELASNRYRLLVLVEHQK